MRLMPWRVKTDSWIAVSPGPPRPNLPPTSLYSPSLFSRTMTRSMARVSPPASGPVTPANERTGRRLTYCPKARRIGISRPQRDTWSGTSGQPTAPSSTASYRPSVSSPSGGISAPSSRYRWQDQPNSSKLQTEVVAGVEGGQHDPRGRGDLGADAVTGDEGDTA